MKKCNYCNKRIWPWQDGKGFNVYDNPRHYHTKCAYDKLFYSMLDLATVVKHHSHEGKISQPSLLWKAFYNIMKNI